MYYPLFLVTRVTKSIDFITIELYQLHYAGGTVIPEASDWFNITGVTETISDFAGGFGEDEPDVPVEPGLFTIPAGYKAVFQIQTNTPANEQVEEQSPFWSVGLILTNSGNLIPNPKYIFPPEGTSGIIDINDTGHQCTVEGFFSTPQNPYTTFKISIGDDPSATGGNIRCKDENASYVEHIMDMDWNIGANMNLEDGINHSMSNFSQVPIVVSPPAWMATLIPVSLEPDPDATYIDPNPDIFAQPGDVNVDAVINVLDVVQLVQYILDISGTVDSITEQGLINADVNDDGIIDILDIVQTVNIILGN